MSNVLDDDESFNDQSDDLNGGVQEGQVAEVPMSPNVRRPSRPLVSSNQELTQNLNVESEDLDEDGQDADAEEEMIAVLSDARLRLEQGRLYEMVMNHDLFAEVTSDARAIKIVQREIRKFAQERMEIMLGMRQEQLKQDMAAFPAELFPFNSLEVETLKALAAAATKGASREAEPFVSVPQAPVKKQTLNPIGGSRPQQTLQPKPKQQKQLAQKPAAPVKRQKVDPNIERILAEEGVTMEEINRTFDSAQPLTKEQLDNMSAEEIAERSKRVRAGRRVPNPAAAPMPTQEHIEAIYTARAGQAAANPQMQMIMNLLGNRK